MRVMGEYERSLVDNLKAARLRLRITSPPRQLVRYAPVNLLSGSSWKLIVKLVSLKHDVPMDTIIGRSALPDHCKARDEAIDLVHSHCGLSLSQVARLFDGRHHTSVLHALRNRAKLSTGVNCGDCALQS